MPNCTFASSHPKNLSTAVVTVARGNAAGLIRVGHVSLCSIPKGKCSAASSTPSVTSTFGEISSTL